MSERCQHCGENLPIIRDVFCSHCGENLSDAPIVKLPVTDEVARWTEREQRADVKTAAPVEAEVPKPTRLQVAISALVIVCSLWLVGSAVAALFITWDACSFFSAVVILPLPSILAVQQYRGTFRGVRSAAAVSSVLLFIVGGFTALTCLTVLGEIATGGYEYLWLGLVLPMFGVAALSLLGAILNLQRRSNLPRNAPDGNWQFSVREILAAVAALCFLAAVMSSFIRGTPPMYAENVSVDKAPFGLPANATDVSYCQGSRGIIAYEFSIDQASFVKWVDSGIGSIESNASSVELERIVTPTTINRYNLFSGALDGPDSITVTSGLEYSWSFEDRGVYAVFDDTTNRAYYYSHPY